MLNKIKEQFTSTVDFDMLWKYKDRQHLGPMLPARWRIASNTHTYNNKTLRSLGFIFCSIELFTVREQVTVINRPELPIKIKIVVGGPIFRLSEVDAKAVDNAVLVVKRAIEHCYSLEAAAMEQKVKLATERQHREHAQTQAAIKELASRIYR